MKKLLISLFALSFLSVLSATAAEEASNNSAENEIAEEESSSLFKFGVDAD